MTACMYFSCLFLWLCLKNEKINSIGYKFYGYCRNYQIKFHVKCSSLTISHQRYVRNKTTIVTCPVSSAGVYDSLRGILNEGKLDVRVQYMIEVMFAIRKDGFKVQGIYQWWSCDPNDDIIINTGTSGSNRGAGSCRGRWSDHSFCDYWRTVWSRRLSQYEIYSNTQLGIFSYY